MTSTRAETAYRRLESRRQIMNAIGPDFYLVAISAASDSGETYVDLAKRSYTTFCPCFPADDLQSDARRGCGKKRAFPGVIRQRVRVQTEALRATGEDTPKKSIASTSYAVLPETVRSLKRWQE